MSADGPSVGVDAVGGEAEAAGCLVAWGTGDGLGGGAAAELGIAVAAVASPLGARASDLQPCQK